MAAVARLIPATAWETRSCGPGCKGRRDYAWAWAATASPRHWVLIRRSLSDPSDLAFYFCHAPQARPVSLPVLIRAAGKRWPVEVGHRWHRSSCFAFSWLCSLFRGGWLFRLCPAGAAVEARRACPAFA